MHDILAFQKLDVYVVAREFACLVHQSGITDTELRDQATRAAKSAFLNIAEGLPDRRQGIRHRHFSIARGSLAEAVSALDCAIMLGAVEVARVPALRACASRLAALLGALLRRR
ncbi:MAG: four helix bundle protein [Polyangiaceae bacterium]|nr:four helix bundle protein [Polyangiaceae bacterium]